MTIEIIIGIVVVISFISLLVVIGRNKIIFSKIKIDEAESNIDLYLNKKKDLLDRARPILKKELKIDDVLVNIDEIEKNNFNHFKINILLHNTYLELLSIVDENEKLLKSKTIVGILDDLESNEEDRVGCIKFYNDSVSTYNKLVSGFPTNIIALFSKCKKKDYYSDDEKEMFQILEDEEEISDEDNREDNRESKEE